MNAFPHGLDLRLCGRAGIVRSSHGNYWVADETDYGAELPDFSDQIVFTIRPNLSDED